ncbi:hypothetical protein V8G54_006555 [Vigna mungo]|uniref:SWIM-type domain-containing protein n=1 Tax=Vigna mungo TaxID=3915 RepID=A0AAQ3S7F8_VIGMU
MCDERIKVVVHHTGHFVTLDNGKLIFDGEITEWSVDPDLWCYFGIVASIKVLGHVNIKELWYSLGGASIVKDRLELLTDDRGVMHMLNIARLNDEVHLYVVHETIEPDIIEMIDWVDGEVEVEVGTQMKDVEVQAIGDADIMGRGLDEGDVGRGLDEGDVEAELRTKIQENQGYGVAAEVGGEMEKVEGDVETELVTELDQVQGDGVAAEVGGEMEKVEGDVETELRTEIQENQGYGVAAEVGGEMEKVEGDVETELVIELDQVQGDGVAAEVGGEMEKVKGDVETELVTELDQVQGDGVAAEVGGEMEKVEGDVETELVTELDQVQGDGVAAEVGGEMEKVEGDVETKLVTELDQVQGDGVHAEVGGEMEQAKGHVENQDGVDGDSEGGEDGDEDDDDDEDDDKDDDEDEDEDEDEGGHDGDDEGDMGTSKGPPCSPMTSDNEAVHDVRGLSDIEWVSDKLESGPDSEDDDGSIPKTLFPTFSMPKSLGEYKWEVGTYFTNKKDFTDAIRTYALSNGKNLKLIKNDKKRVTVKCLGANGKCKWYAYCAYVCHDKSWQLRKVIDEHTCSRDFNVKLITTKWLSERMEKTMRESPNMKVMDIREKLSRKWNVAISKNMAFRARTIAKSTVEGSFKEQFRRLYDYGHEVLQRNPGSTVQIKVENHNDERIFKRIYICLKACKDSFRSCRPIIGLDGCFLKGRYGGELLTAVGRDVNEQILPIAYAVVEVENKDSWSWFLELLIQDVGGVDVASSCTFISDQQKGLLHAFEDLLPRVDQRYCVRHMYANFRKQFPGKDLKRLMWSAATATYPQLWESEMRKIKDMNLEAFKYLMATPPRYWSRSRFSPSSHCDTLVNNMCEGFNSVLLHTRCKPIISMLEDIRVYIMKRWATNRNKMACYQGDVCPKVLNRFQKQSWLTRYWLPRWSSDQLFEVIHISQFGEQFVVNLQNKDCSCRGWLITDIPCTHAITAMKFLNLNAEEYIAPWYRKSAYQDTYKSIVYLINGQHVWEITPYPDILPPKKRVMPERPKKKRRLQSWELKKNDSELRKGGRKKACAVCKQLGHNKKTCPQRPRPSSHVPADQPTQQSTFTHVPANQPTQESTVKHVPADQPTQESTVLPSHQ